MRDGPGTGATGPNSRFQNALAMGLRTQEAVGCTGVAGGFVMRRRWARRVSGIYRIQEFRQPFHDAFLASHAGMLVEGAAIVRYCSPGQAKSTFQRTRLYTGGNTARPKNGAQKRLNPVSD